MALVEDLERLVDDGLLAVGRRVPARRIVISADDGRSRGAPCASWISQRALLPVSRAAAASRLARVEHVQVAAAAAEVDDLAAEGLDQVL